MRQLAYLPVLDICYLYSLESGGGLVRDLKGNYLLLIFPKKWQSADIVTVRIARLTCLIWKSRKQGHNLSLSSPTAKINQGMRMAMYPKLYEKKVILWPACWHEHFCAEPIMECSLLCSVFLLRWWRCVRGKDSQRLCVKNYTEDCVLTLPDMQVFIFTPYWDRQHLFPPSECSYIYRLFLWLMSPRQVIIVLSKAMSCQKASWRKYSCL